VENNSASGGTENDHDRAGGESGRAGIASRTRLVARLQSVVNSAIKTPIVAAIEYNYEKDGQIVVPAGAKVLGTLQQADRSGNVAIHFDALQLPDGATQKIDAAAMSLSFGPLKGNVSGRKTGTNFLVRTFTGLGTVATYLVGAGGTNGFNGPLSESALLRDRLATNIGIAGDQELNSLAFNQNIVCHRARKHAVLRRSGKSHRVRRRTGAASRNTTGEQCNAPHRGRAPPALAA